MYEFYLSTLVFADINYLWLLTSLSHVTPSIITFSDTFIP